MGDWEPTCYLRVNKRASPPNARFEQKWQKTSQSYRTKTKYEWRPIPCVHEGWAEWSEGIECNVDET